MGLPVITRKGSLQQFLFLRQFVKSPVLGLVNANRWDTKQNVLFQLFVGCVVSLTAIQD